MIPGVTGATGFVGMVHIAALCRAGIRPRILVRGDTRGLQTPDEVEVVNRRPARQGRPQGFWPWLNACFSLCGTSFIHRTRATATED